MEPIVLLEHILDGREKPTNLPFALLKSITENFSEDREIGHGGFATVYKGVLPNGNVAVKRIRSSHSINQKLFYRELDSLLTINHQNVVRFLGFCASTDETAIQIEGSKGHIYAEVRERLLCLEYINNGSLQKYITDELRGLEWNTRYDIVRGICEGLHHLHNDKQIYHMDLKPTNILIDNHMIPKITDFGLSRLDEKSQTMSEGRLGSLGYCAPEYLRDGKMSFKSDMYSLGVIIIELVTGERGIPDNNNDNVLRRWRHRWRKSGKETALAYQQVAKCIEIGLLCQEIDPSKRPYIWNMIHDIREMEGVNGKVGNAKEYTFGQISPYSEDDMLGVEPLELHFSFERNKQMSCSLQLTNETDSFIAFDVEKTSPLPYCAEPHKGIVPPRSNCNVDITLQPRDKAPGDMQCANVFIVRSTRVNDGFVVEGISTKMFDKQAGNVVVDAVNLDVNFDKQPQRVPLDAQEPGFDASIRVVIDAKLRVVTDAISHIYSGGKFTADTFLRVTSISSDLVPDKHQSGSKLYSAVETALASEVQSLVSEIRAGRFSRRFLNDLLASWHRHMGALSAIGPVLVHLDKYHATRRGLPTVYKMGLNLWRDHVVLFDKVLPRLIKDLRKEIRETKSRYLISSVSEMLKELGDEVYQQVMDAVDLDETS